MPLIEDIRSSFEAKGLKFISLAESKDDPDKSVLTYRDAAGETSTKSVGIRLEDLEETVLALDGLDPADLAAFLIGEPDKNGPTQSADEEEAP